MRKLFVQAVLVAAAAVGVSGCGSAVINAAQSGDMESFRARLNERVASGDIDVSEAKKIAHAVVTRQIESAQGPLGVDSIAFVEPCAEAFDGALSERAAHKDEVAAHATLLRQEIGQVSPMEHADLVNSADDHWRAVGARSLSKPGGGGDLKKARTWRQRLMADTSRVVRLSAVRASAEARDRDDTLALLETARLDPDPEVRLSAIAAVGMVGTQEGVRGLKDVWTEADHEGKLAIVHAWAAAWRRPYHDGGDAHACVMPAQSGSCEAFHQLTRASDEGSGMPALLASLELIHDVSPSEAKTPEGNAAAVVERLIDKGAPRVRIEAIASAPIGWAHLLEAVVDAAEDDEPRVAVAANARLLEVESERDKAIERLRKTAKGRGQAAVDAQRALVVAKDASVTAAIEARAKGKSGEERSQAAEDFAHLGDANRAAALLGDQDVKVRSDAACTILGME